jgi:methyl-accepting chemotaxis protein
MKNLPISRQLILLVVALMAAFAATTYFQIRSSVNAIYEERYGMLRTQVQSSISILQSFYDKEKAGTLTHEQAMSQAFAIVAAMKYTPDGYMFGYDYDVKMLFHPEAKRVGQSYKGKPDSQGFNYRDELVRLARAGGGQTSFYGPKPGAEGDTYAKSSYAMAFEPWQVVVVTGVYIDDLQAQVRSTIINAISFGVGVFLLGLLAAYVVIRGISKPLDDIHKALGEVANENVDLTIPHADMRNEIGLMAKATKALQQKVRERHAMQARQDEQQQQLDDARAHSVAGAIARDIEHRLDAVPHVRVHGHEQQFVAAAEERPAQH